MLEGKLRHPGQLSCGEWWRDRLWVPGQKTLLRIDEGEGHGEGANVSGVAVESLLGSGQGESKDKVVGFS